jgi:hypothetical protein
MEPGKESETSWVLRPDLPALAVDSEGETDSTPIPKIPDLPGITRPHSFVSVNTFVETYPVPINDIEYEADNEGDCTHFDLTFPTLLETFEALLLDSTSLGNFFEALLLDSTLGEIAVLGRRRKMA